MAIRAALIAVFDEVVGRKVAHQTPEGFIGPEEFDAISEYVIPKPQLCGQLVSLTALGATVMGFPVCIEDAKYPRNALLFNLCLVLGDEAAEEEAAYGALLAKLGRALRTLEIEAAHLSEPARRADLGRLLPRLVGQLNVSRECTLLVDMANIIRLRLPPRGAAPRLRVRPHHVPVLVAAPGSDMLSADLALRRLLPYIDGQAPARAIAVTAGIDAEWALDCLTDLAHVGCVVLADLYDDGNVYSPTSRLHALAASEPARAACVAHAARVEGSAPAFSAVFALYCRLRPSADGHWATVGDACASLSDAERCQIDVRKAMQFGVINGYISRVHAHPWLVASAGREPAHTLPPALAARLNGTVCADELCCEIGCSPRELRAALDGVCAWVYRAEPAEPAGCESLGAAGALAVTP